MIGKLKKLDQLGYKIYSKTTDKFPVIGGYHWIDSEDYDELISDVEVIVHFENILKLVYVIWHGANGSSCALAVFDSTEFGKDSYTLNYELDSISQEESIELEKLKIEDLKISSIEQKIYFK